VARHSQSQEKFKQVVTQVLNSGKKVPCSITLNYHPFAGAIKHHTEVEALLVTGGNLTEVLKRVLNWLV
jgi:nucleoside-triphosphatase THEP1